MKTIVWQTQRQHIAVISVKPEKNLHKPGIPASIINKA